MKLTDAEIATNFKRLTAESDTNETSLTSLTARVEAVETEVDGLSGSSAWGGITGTLSNQTDLQNALNAKEATANKNAASGYAGLTSNYAIQFKNLLGTIINFFTNSTTAARTYTFQDRSGTIADVEGDIAGVNTALALKMDKETLTDNAIVRADGTAGDVQNSGITIDDNNNIVLPATAASSQSGHILKSTTRWLHDYKGNASTSGGNVFLGNSAGNFTLNWGGVNTYEASNNIGVGASALSSLTTGYQNVCAGFNAGTAITTGFGNFGMGGNALTKVTTNSQNAAIGSEAIRYNTGATNTAFGAQALKGTDGSSTGGSNVALGFQTGLAVTTGATNIFVGYRAGDTTTTGSNNIIIGKDSEASGATVSNQLNIGNVLYGANMYGTGSIGIGITPTNITARLHLPAGSTSASSAPLKFTSGSLNTTAEAGAMEYLTDDLYITITTGNARKPLIIGNVALQSGGRIPYTTTNGRLTDDVSFTFDGTVLNVPEAELTGALTLPEISTPSNPATGFLKLYFKGGVLYKLDSSGTETSIG